MRALTWVAGLALVGAGCKLYTLPDTPPAREPVLEAARQVVEELYPMSVVVEKSNHVFALGPIELFGNRKARKQVAVWVRRNYLGAWEPAVRVTLFQEVGEPAMRADPTSENPDLAVPVVRERWEPVQTLPLEEARLTQAIWERLGGATARSEERRKGPIAQLVRAADS